MFATIVRYVGKKPKPKMKPIELKTPPEQTQTITRVIFDIVKEHGPLTIADTWERVKVTACFFFGGKLTYKKFKYSCNARDKEVGVRGLTSKRHMKIVLRWMRERQKLRQICNHVGPQKQFLYTTWFTKPNIMQTRRAGNASPRPKP